MATKKATKKSPAKKTTAKRAYNRKTPAKAVTKRKYTRKAKTVESPEVAINPPAQDEVLTAAVLGLMGEAEAEQNKPAGLAAIDVIDLREAPAGARLAVLSVLDKEGYVTRGLQNLLENDVLAYVLFHSEALALQHKNKIVTFKDWFEVTPDEAVSSFETDTRYDVTFSPAQTTAPATVMIDGIAYNRA